MVRKEMSYVCVYLLVVTAGFLLNATPMQSPPSSRDAQERPIRRLESVTWDAVEKKLTWEVSEGEVTEELKYKASSEPFKSYQIDMKDAIMSFGGERRRFSGEEAANMRYLMGQIIELYAVASVRWWEEGKGEPVDGAAPKKERERGPKERPSSKKPMLTASFH